MREQHYRNLEDRAAALSSLRDLLATATDLVICSAPSPLVGELTPELDAALADDVLVLLLVGGEVETSTGERPYPATLVRHWERPIDFVTAASVDYDRGFYTEAELHDSDGQAGRALRYRDQFFGDLQLNTMLFAWWQRSSELYAADPAPLPTTHDSFFRAVIDAARFLREDQPLAARIEGRTTDTNEPATVDGEVINVRQSIISPATNSFPIEQSIFVASTDGVVSAGSQSAQVEDLRADRVEFYEP
ncbi:transcriptional regulator [Salinarchaeum sp. Harcht-Bsk1]|uniref:TrmB family transcriptional regulator sugar-binding domain-containing protein n=1 Tax=Salinarchaeum sp. Harcht-Bsk1 TaxID=1333523 RepID=UPI0003424734|nr:TrmB family transcriptional regulator sugar-binding domain-containing protein [Salinarchaeum sp. Harcht-Bsk1]AGN01418.1 transcriptional regulator [Salinarchaeum sp. Harcht-Bsk1]